MMNGRTERQFTVVDWLWFAGVLVLIYAGLGIGLTLMGMAVQP